MKRKPLTAYILSPWTTADIGTGQTGNVPQIMVDYPEVDFTDETGQPAQNLPPDPNYVLLACRMDQRTLNTILNDATYTVVRKSGDVGTIVPQATRTQILNRLAGLSLESGEWAHVRQRLVVYLKARPKRR